MCFLAFDARCKVMGLARLDLNPDTPDGKANREGIAREFSRLVLLDPQPTKRKQVLELGKISGAGKDPAERLSSNFLTVPLKKATEHTGPFIYPRRPACAPMIKLGQAATGLRWGMEYHEKWETSLPRLLTEVKESTPFTDLAVFVLRDTLVTGDGYIQALKSGIASRFSPSLASFWNGRIAKEGVLSKHFLASPFSATHQSFARTPVRSPAAELRTVPQEVLLDHISHLEDLLRLNHIEFQLLTERGKP